MITLYCDPRSRECQQFNEKLNTLSAAHRMVEINSQSPGPVLSCGGRTPTLMDGQECFCGAKEVAQHLESLKSSSGSDMETKDSGESESGDFIEDDWSMG